MATVDTHYRDHLAPVYAWMAGGADAAFASGAAELDALGLPSHSGQSAIDLGAGFGMHSVPFARKGGRVLAIDSSQELLATLTTHAAGLSVRTVHDDLLAFPEHLTEAPQVVLCMGDTITHLPSLSSVEQLLPAVAWKIAAGGTFVVTLRDYTRPLTAEQRFIPVRSDDTRILTCFIEYADDVVVVHDVLHQRIDGEWRMSVSSYRKLRIDPDALVEQARSCGFDVRREPGIRGMVRLVCKAA